MIATSAVETRDTPLIDVVIDTARQISAAFETAIERGEIRIEQLMDEKYREIPGTDPKQYLTDYVGVTDRLLHADPGPDPEERSPDRVLRRHGRRAATSRPTIRTIACRRATTPYGTTPIAATSGCSATVP